MNNEELKDMEIQIKDRLKKIKKKIIVLSNKGGVGKTSFSVLFSQVLVSMSRKTGLLDSDICGPSVLTAVGLEGKRIEVSPFGILPLKKDNLNLMSMAAISGNRDVPIIWRGPMKTVFLRQILSETDWGDLDYLVVDSPPGTGDEPLSVIQLMGGMDGGIIVTTPQEIALLDSRKCVGFLKNMKVPVLGIVENMSGMVCPHCGKEVDLFRKGGGKTVAEEMGIPFLGDIPFDPRIVDAMDKGINLVKNFKESPLVGKIKSITEKIENSLR